MVETSIVILSYRRPEGLRRALLSCLAQEAATGYEIVVVDNDVEGSAQPVAAVLAKESPVPIRYVAEPRPGISHARNTGVANARGEYLAFLDDDETAEPHWLASFIAAMRRFEADAAVGPVYPRFPPDVEVNPHCRNVYTRDARAPSGTRLMGWNIGNSIFRRERCFVGPEPFDPNFGLTGGEDTVFMRQMTRRGCKMVWCAEAKVWEDVPAARLDPGYLLRRAFHGGQTSSLLCTMAQTRDWLRLGRMIAGGAVQIVIYGPAGVLLRFLNHPRWLGFSAKAAGGVGKLLFHPKLHPRIYR